ncbi:MAG: ATP-binding cassette domain-containing protein, partial [Saccharothrix sp.]|nr:ATP-binding cassette domain-containing protein [Saccharothrix sp.]
RHRNTTVLHDVDLDVGERLAVVGRSGSGKTTLGRCLAGLHQQATGEVLLHDRPLARSLRRRPRAALAAVQYVFQDARGSFDEHRSVLDQVARTAVRLRGVRTAEARAAALAALGRVGLAEETVLRRPRGLSGGELQRAALVRALLAEPEVLVCDEISHDLDVVARLADQVVVLHEGRVAVHGPVATTLDGAKERMK